MFYTPIYKHVNLLIRGDNTRCDETTSAWVNMTGFHTRVIGRNIGDRNNPLMMDANHTVRPPSHCPTSSIISGYDLFMRTIIEYY